MIIILKYIKLQNSQDNQYDWYEQQNKKKLSEKYKKENNID